MLLYWRQSCCRSLTPLTVNTFQTLLPLYLLPPSLELTCSHVLLHYVCGPTLDTPTYKLRGISAYICGCVYSICARIALMMMNMHYGLHVVCSRVITFSLACPPVTKNLDPPKMVPPVLIFRNIWTPRNLYFSASVEIYGPPLKFLFPQDLTFRSAFSCPSIKPVGKQMF